MKNQYEKREGSSYRGGEIKCPVCSKVLDGATELGEQGNGPKPNDFSVCIYCASILVYNEDLKLIKVTPDDLTKLQQEDKRVFELLLKTVMAVKAMRAEFN